MIKNKNGKEINMFNMYGAYSDFKALYDFYNDNKNIKTESEILDRIEYIKKWGANQKSEIETLYWVLGKNIVGEDL